MSNVQQLKYYEQISYTLLLAWVLMPIFILFAQSQKLDQIIGNLFLMYISVLGIITLFFVLIYTNKKYSISGLTFLRKVFGDYNWNYYLLLMLLWILLSSILSQNKYMAFFGSNFRNQGFFTYCLYIGIYLCSMVIRTEKKQLQILYFFLLSSIPLCFITILQYFDYPTDLLGIYYNGNSISNMKFSSIFYNINHYGYYLTIACAVSSTLGILSINNTSKFSYFVIYSLNCWSLLVNNTFGCYLAVLATTAILPFFYKKHKGKLKLISTVPLVIIFFLTFTTNSIVYNNFSKLFSDLHNISVNEETAKFAGSNRWELWTNGIEMLGEKPVFGYGPENLDYEYAKRGISQERPHNEYLQYALFSGLPTLIFYLLFITSLLKKWYHQIPEGNPHKLVFGIATITYLFSAFFGNTMYYTIIYFFIILGFLSKNCGVKSS